MIMQPNGTIRNGLGVPLALSVAEVAQPLAVNPAAASKAPPVLQVSPLTAVVTQPDGSKCTVTAEVVLVTPQMAEAWLGDESRHRNRKSSDRRIGAYRRDMERGRWRVTNQGLGFDASGKLIDGEHRLRAVIESGCPTAFMVVRGLPTATQNAVDVGRPRSMADQYAMWTGNDKAKNRIAAARVMQLIVNGWTNEVSVLTYEEQAELVEKYRPELDWAFGVFQRRSGQALTSAPVVGAWAYAFGADNTVGRWVSSYLDGAGLDRGDPLLALRNHMAKPALHGIASRRSTTLRVLRALWAKLHGETLSKLYDSTEGLVGFVEMRGDPVASSWGEWRAKDYPARNP